VSSWGLRSSGWLEGVGWPARWVRGTGCARSGSAAEANARCDAAVAAVGAELLHAGVEMGCVQAAAAAVAPAAAVVRARCCRAAGAKPRLAAAAAAASGSMLLLYWW